jgi:hypothetical protein
MKFLKSQEDAKIEAHWLSYRDNAIFDIYALPDGEFCVCLQNADNAQYCNEIDAEFVESVHNFLND